MEVDTFMCFIEKNECEKNKGKIVSQWLTGDEECNAVSYEYECGAIYNRNYMDRIGFRDHDCFWDCSSCKKKDTECHQ